MTGENLRKVMRHWATGVSIVTSRSEDRQHGLTANSLASVSLEPPVVVVTLAHATRTYSLVMQSRIAGITILSEAQQELAELFAGKIPEQGDRLAGLDTFTLITGAPMISGGIGYLDCQVLDTHPLEVSTLFILKVLKAKPVSGTRPLLYFNRNFTRLEK